MYTGVDTMMGRAPGRGQNCGSDVQNSRFAAEICTLLSACRHSNIDISDLQDLSGHAMWSCVSHIGSE